MSEPFKFAVLTISDRCHAGVAKDTAGPALRAMLSDRAGGEEAAAGLVPDEAGAIAGQLQEWAAASPPPELIVTTGGTGLGPRDVTPEATKSVLEREHAGLMELVRATGAKATPRAYLSRGVAGTIGQSLVINLPGSERGALESLEALLDLLPHAVAMLRGEGHSRTYDSTPLP